MVCYLVKLQHKKTGLVLYKRGTTKWPNPLDRFKDDKYSIFDITVLATYSYSHESWTKAHTVVNVFEQVLNGLWPPKEKEFNVEKYLGEEAGALDNTGITEFIYLKATETEEQLINHFEMAKKSMWKIK